MPDDAHPEDAEVVKDALGTALASPGEIVRFVARFGGPDEWAWCESIATNLLDEPMVGAVVVNSWDITETKRLEQRLAGMAVRDELTGLVNRTAFLDQYRDGPCPIEQYIRHCLVLPRHRRLPRFR